MFEVALKSLRRSIAFAGVVVVIAASVSGAVRAAGDKELQRVSGTVGYELADNGPFNPVIGSLPLPDKAYAITQANSSGILRMPDSSEIGLGANTRVQLTAFNDIRNGPGNEITINNGALKFDIRHPAGKKANYKFITPTSQIAVRGTIGLIAVTAAANGTSTTTIACVSGSFTATVGSTTLTLASGQAVTVVGGSVTTSSLGSVVSNFQQAGISSPTGAGAGVGGVGGGTVGGSTVGGTSVGGTVGGGAGATGAIAGGAAGAGVVGAAVATNANSTQSTPAPTPSPVVITVPTTVPSTTPTMVPSTTPTTAPLSLTLGGTALGAQNQLFASSVPQSAPAGVTGPSGPIAVSTTGAVSADQSTVTGPSATFNLLIQAFSNGTLTASASGLSVSAAFSIYGPLAITPTTLSLTSIGQTATFTVQQSGPTGASITIATPSCQTGFGATVNASKAPVGSTATSITVTETAVPNTTSNSPGCTIAITGQAAQSVTVSLNLSTTSININGQRGALPSTRSPR